MFQRYFTLKDESWATGAACLLFTSAPLTPLVVPHRLVSTLGPTWLWMCMPFLLVVAGILALTKLKALDTLRQILVVSLGDRIRVRRCAPRGGLLGEGRLVGSKSRGMGVSSARIAQLSRPQSLPARCCSNFSGLQQPGQICTAVLWCGHLLSFKQRRVGVFDEDEEATLGRIDARDLG